MFDVDYETINIGDAEDDGTGTTRRRGFEFINSNTLRTLANMGILNDNINSIRTSASSLDSELEDLPSFPAHSAGVIITLPVEPTAARISRARGVGLNSAGLAVLSTSTNGVFENPTIGMSEANGTTGVGGMIRVRLSGLTGYGVAAGGQRIYLNARSGLPTPVPSAVFVGISYAFRLSVNVIINP